MSHSKQSSEKKLPAGFRKGLDGLAALRPQPPRPAQPKTQPSDKKK